MAFDRGGAVTWKETQDEARAALVAAWSRDTAHDPGVIVFAYTNRDVDRLNAEFRAVRRELGGLEAEFETKHGRAAFAVGDRVQLTANTGLYNGTVGAVALAGETKTIPIVFVTVSDPIGSGLAASLTHPGGNITGFTFVESEMGGKWFQLLREIAPATARVALLFNPVTSPPLKFYLPSIEVAARASAIQVDAAPVHDEDEIEPVIAALARYSGSGVIVMPDAFNAANRRAIITATARHRVPAIYGNDFTEEGGLIFYGADFTESFRLAAGYVARVLNGAKPGELPIQLPTKLTLGINLKTAEALGLTVPPLLLSRADEVIE